MVSVPLPENNHGGRRDFGKGHRDDEPNFEALPDSLPPQNLEAEEAVLGGILLDPDAIGRVADVLQPEAFYLNAHREIFRTALMLHGQGKPTDLTAMSAWLADTGALEKVGGNNRLVELVERVPSTASIEQVARLVMDKFLRRQLIRSGNEVIQLGFDQGLPMEQVLDQAEQKIFAISQEKPSKGLTPTAEILTQTFEEIESRSLGTSVAGIPVNASSFLHCCAGVACACPAPRCTRAAPRCTYAPRPQPVHYTYVPSQAFFLQQAAWHVCVLRYAQTHSVVGDDSYSNRSALLLFARGALPQLQFPLLRARGLCDTLPSTHAADIGCILHPLR